MNQNISFVSVIETTKGEIKVDEVATSFKHIFMHEILSPVLDSFSSSRPITSNRPVNLENYKFHLSQPFTLQNTSLTAGLIDHQLQNLVLNDGCSHKQILIMDGSQYEQKIAQLYEKYVLVKGYSYRLSSKDVKEIFLTYQHILKQVEYEFKFGNGKFKPGFIGQISLLEAQNTSRMHQAFSAYLTFSQRTGCPIIVNCLQQGITPIYANLGYQKLGLASSIENLYQIWGQIRNLQSLLSGSKQSKVVLYNIPLKFQYKIDSQKYSQTVTCQVHDEVITLLSQPSIYVGFDLLRYTRQKYAIDYIAMLINAFPNKIIVSSGLRYKTDLTAFAGEGYLLNAKKPALSDLYRRMHEIIGEQSTFSKVIYQNKWNLLAWKLKEVEIQIVATWNCSKCGLVQSEKIEKFRKFGKQFCSIKCLKA